MVAPAGFVLNQPTLVADVLSDRRNAGASLGVRREPPFQGSPVSLGPLAAAGTALPHSGVASFDHKHQDLTRPRDVRSPHWETDRATRAIRVQAQLSEPGKAFRDNPIEQRAALQQSQRHFGVYLVNSNQQSQRVVESFVQTEHMGAIPKGGSFAVPIKCNKSARELPANSVAILKGWFHSPKHFAYPYPTEQEQIILMRKTGLQKKQIKDWFKNARKRIWKPVLKKRLKKWKLPTAATVTTSGRTVARVVVAPDETVRTWQQGSLGPPLPRTALLLSPSGPRPTNSNFQAEHCKNHPETKQSGHSLGGALRGLVTNPREVVQLQPAAANGDNILGASEIALRELTEAIAKQKQRHQQLRTLTARSQQQAILNSKRALHGSVPNPQEVVQLELAAANENKGAAEIALRELTDVIAKQKQSRQQLQELKARSQQQAIPNSKQAFMSPTTRRVNTNSANVFDYHNLIQCTTEAQNAQRMTIQESLGQNKSMSLGQQSIGAEVQLLRSGLQQLKRPADPQNIYFIEKFLNKVASIVPEIAPAIAFLVPKGSDPVQSNCSLPNVIDATLAKLKSIQGTVAEAGISFRDLQTRVTYCIATIEPYTSDRLDAMAGMMSLSGMAVETTRPVNHAVRPGCHHGQKEMFAGQKSGALKRRAEENQVAPVNTDDTRTKAKGHVPMIIAYKHTKKATK